MGLGACAVGEACVDRSVVAAPIVGGTGARDEVKAFLRIEGTEEDATLDRLIAVAIGCGEDFTGRVFLIRDLLEVQPATTAWQRLGRAPVRAITALATLAADGTVIALTAPAYAVDIDAGGDGWVRLMGASVGGRVQATYQAGVAAGWDGLPEPLRQGAVRLAAHLFTHRDAADGGAPPAAVAALWRPWRRMRLL